MFDPAHNIEQEQQIKRSWLSEILFQQKLHWE